MNDIQSYIGNSTKGNMNFIISINTTDLNNINKNTINISALDSLDNEVNVSEFKLQSYDMMYQSGINDLNYMIATLQQDKNQESLVSPLSQVSAQIINVNNWNNYNRINARDYAYAWWGPNDSNYN